MTPLRACILTYVVFLVALILFEFPYHTDAVSEGRRPGASQHFYDQAYAPPQTSEEAAKEDAYVAIGRKSAEDDRVEDDVRGFVKDYGLENKRILDVGSGRGYLQDVVTDYTGLDISGTVRRFYHKPFVQASATEMPFEDNRFDAVWSIWVLEHVPNPEQMLTEMRRVVKPNGLLYLAPAWYCTPFAAQGYPVRPYSDFGLKGKLIKATGRMAGTPGFAAMYRYPIRGLRWAGTKLGSGPTRFHYQLLSPNYDQYWMPDSDALNSMDAYEGYLWFLSRGDECLNCRGPWSEFADPRTTMVLRIRKP